MKCHNCSGIGHIAVECSSKKTKTHSANVSYTNEEEGSGEKKNNSVYEEEEDEDDDEESHSAHSANSTKKDEKDERGIWILDSGATAHHTGDRRLLSEIKTLTQARTTKTGNGTSTYDKIGRARVETEGGVM